MQIPNENENRDMLITKWIEASRNLAAAKEAELQLRQAVLNECFSFDPEALREGTENLELGQGYKLKAGFKISRSLGSDIEAIEKVLQKIEKSGPEGEFVAERLVKWKAELSVTEYKKLPEKIAKIVNELVVSKPSTPSLEFVEPKSK